MHSNIRVPRIHDVCLREVVFSPHEPIAWKIQQNDTVKPFHYCYVGDEFLYLYITATHGGTEILGFVFDINNKVDCLWIGSTNWTAKVQSGPGPTLWDMDWRSCRNVWTQTT